MKASLKIIFGVMVCFLLIGYGVAFAQESQEQTQEQTQEQQTAPAEEQAVQQAEPSAPPAKSGELPPALEAEMTVAEHWSKNPYPRTVAAGNRVHIVEKGDTLWDLAARYLNNPFLWPQIWDANKYIPNAHWIYPGDPIVIPGVAPVSEEKIAEAQPPAEEVPPSTEGTTIAPPEKKVYPIGLDIDLYCSGFIGHTPERALKIIGNEENIQKVTLANFDVVYLNQGEAEGISPGDEFTIIHQGRSIEHPITLHHLGDYLVQTGRLKVVATQEHTSTAQITYACDASLVDDYLVPFEPKEVPMLTELPPVDRFSLEGPNAKGYVVFAKDDLSSLGLGHELMIDLGSKDGLQPGSRLVLYREAEKGYEQREFEKELPRTVLGEMVVFNVGETTSTGRIIQTYNYVKIGDRVEVR